MKLLILSLFVLTIPLFQKTQAQVGTSTGGASSGGYPTKLILELSNSPSRLMVEAFGDSESSRDYWKGLKLSSFYYNFFSREIYFIIDIPSDEPGVSSKAISLPLESIGHFQLANGEVLYADDLVYDQKFFYAVYGASMDRVQEGTFMEYESFFQEYQYPIPDHYYNDDSLSQSFWKTDFEALAQLSRRQYDSHGGEEMDYTFYEKYAVGERPILDEGFLAHQNHARIDQTINDFFQEKHIAEKMPPLDERFANHDVEDLLNTMAQKFKMPDSLGDSKSGMSSSTSNDIMFIYLKGRGTYYLDDIEQLRTLTEHPFFFLNL